MVHAHHTDNHFNNRSVALQCHPASGRGEINQVHVSVHRNTTGLQCRFKVQGAIDTIKIPESQTSGRYDELWRHTCAETFFTTPDTTDYCELNFSPSSQWAAYQFTGYRQGMQSMQCESPSISVHRDTGQLDLAVNIALPAKYQVSSLQLGLCMVIENTLGDCSYWALRHAAPLPDFHQRESWTYVV